MDANTIAQQVWIFVQERDQWHHKPLYLAILDFLRAEGVAGATVFRGIAGYGARREVHTASLVELASELPLAIIFIDRPDRVERIMPRLTEMVQVGLISTAPVSVLTSGHRAPGPFPAELTVADVMTRDVAQVQPETPAHEIVTLLIDRALRALPVVAEHRVVGIITDGDLLTRGGLDLSIALRRALPPPDRAAASAARADSPHCAADLMTMHPLTLPSATPLAQAAAMMAARKLKRMPVVDDQGRLVGMVSRSDLLKTVAEGLRQRAAEPIRLPAGAPATVGEIMLRAVPAVHRDTPLAETLDRLLETEKRRVIVVDDDNRVVGIITDGDVLQRAARRVRSGGVRSLATWLAGGARPAALEVAARGRTAADIMTSPVATILPETPIAEAIRLMMTHTIKRLPVVDARGRLIGLVGRAGLLAAISHQHDRSQEGDALV